MKNFKATLLLVLMATSPLIAQMTAFDSFITDSTMRHGEVSFHLIDAETGSTLFEHNGMKSLTPASVLKLVTSAAALELLGPDHIFTTTVGYSGTITRSGILEGNIIIRGGGDPALGSPEFGDHYRNFMEKWVTDISNTGIRKIKGRVITDDSYFDYNPVPGKWLWEDLGNYYGAGAYGLSLYDNTYEIHFRTYNSGQAHEMTGTLPEQSIASLNDMLTVAGTTDNGYIFSAPYNNSGWIAGSIPAGANDFILKASINDPPLFMATIFDSMLEKAGIKTGGDPATARTEGTVPAGFNGISEIQSPPLKDIITVLNHESMNLYAEHLIKELGKRFRNSGSADSGLAAVHDFLAAVPAHDGIFMTDGSGLSPMNGVSAEALSHLLLYMKDNSPYFDVFYNSLPEAGKEGTLKKYFRDPVFESGMRAKSGSMTRVRAYAGYMTAGSGRSLIFCIIVNNFTGASAAIVSHIEDILKEIIITF